MNECFADETSKHTIEHALDSQMSSMQDDIDWLNDKLQSSTFEMTAVEREQVIAYKERIMKTQDEIYEMLEKIKKIPVCTPPSFLPY